jgi:hypothetical protein
VLKAALQMPLSEGVYLRITAERHLTSLSSFAERHLECRSEQILSDLLKNPLAERHLTSLSSLWSVVMLLGTSQNLQLSFPIKAPWQSDIWNAALNIR